MKKLLSITLLIIAIILVTPIISYAVEEEASNTVWSGLTASHFNGGSGSYKDPYLIANGEQLSYLAYEVNSGRSFKRKYVKLISNIDLNNIEWVPIGKSQSSYDNRKFEGDFNGNNKTISNLSINSRSIDNVGLFGKLGVYGNVYSVCIDKSVINGKDNIGAVVGINAFGTVSNCVVDVNIRGKNNVGGIVGSNYGIVTTCRCNGNINSNGMDIGGIVGKNYSGAIANCCNIANIICNGKRNMGGIVGQNEGTTVNCCNNGDVISNSGVNIGGIIGYNSGNVFNCYNSSHIKGLNNVAGIVGSNTSYELCSYKSNVISCHWNTDLYTGKAINDYRVKNSEEQSESETGKLSCEEIVKRFNNVALMYNKTATKVYFIEWTLSKDNQPQLKFS